MFTPETIVKRFPFLTEGEVAYVCEDGVIFNKGSEAERLKNARLYANKRGFEKPQKVVGVTLETEEKSDDAPAAEESTEEKKPTTRRKRTTTKK